MLMDARILLEGKLEEIERATSAAEAALAAARRGRWSIVLHGLDATSTPVLSAAIDAAERAALHEPDLGRPLRRLERARVRLTDFIRERTRERGIPIASVRTQVEQLRDDRVAFDGQVRSPWRLLLIPQGILCLIGAAFGARPVSLQLGLVGVMCLLLPLFPGVPVLVSRHVLKIRKRVIPVADIIRVWFTTDLNLNHWSLRHFVEIELRGSVLRTKLPSAPDELLAALEAVGIEVVRRDQGWI
jgi:hypothetical protein